MSTEYDQEKAFQEELAKVTDESIKSKLLQIKELVVKRINLEKQFKTEQCKLEAKYEQQYAPFYKERSEIINGEKVVNEEEVKDVLKNVTIASYENKEQGIPDFWLTCLKHSNQFGALINEKDEKVLKFLKNITIDYKENGNFTLVFHFNQNSAFAHTELQRDFLLDDKGAIHKIESTKIQWTSEEENPTVKQKKKKIVNKSNPSDVKKVTKTEECESFFNFFKDYTAPDYSKVPEKKKEDDDDEEIDENEYIDEEFELGNFFKDELIPYSLEYYLDLVDEEDDFEEGEDDEDDEDDDEDKKEKPKKKLF